MLIFVLIFVGKRIRQTLKTLYISRFFRFVLIILYSHSNASLLINMGVPVKVIAEHLGHCDTRTTEKIYAHIFEDTMVQASDAIAQALTTVGK